MMDQAENLRKMVKGESEKIAGLMEDANAGAVTSGNAPRVISVTSGKGGVGKTNIVGNLAIALQRMGKKVLIFDADLGLANIDIIFGIHPMDNIDSVIRGEKKLSEIIVQGPEGVSIIPASSGIEEVANLTEGQKLNMLSEFDDLNDQFDIMLIDTGAGISSNVVYFNLAAQERIVVVTPEPTSITDAYALLKVMFSRYGTKEFSILLNMVTDEKEAKGVFKNLSNVADKFLVGISLDYAGFIPGDDTLKKAVIKRRPVICEYPRAVASEHIRILAEHLLNQADRPVDGNIKFFWKQLINGAD
ncbi:MAG: MinD/ParA family protein [Desulfobacterium sp.]